MNYQGQILYVGEEPVGKYAQKLKRLLIAKTLANLATKSKGGRARKKPYFVIKPNGCWEWNRVRSWAGRGLVSNGQGKTVLAHRFFYKKLTGKLTEGMTLDHLCVNPPCCNPEHLEEVTHAENLKRGWRRHPEKMGRNGWKLNNKCS
jgi:hypothetical protein